MATPADADMVPFTCKRLCPRPDVSASGLLELNGQAATNVVEELATLVAAELLLAELVATDDDDNANDVPELEMVLELDAHKELDIGLDEDEIARLLTRSLLLETANCVPVVVSIEGISFTDVVSI